MNINSSVPKILKALGNVFVRKKQTGYKYRLEITLLQFVIVYTNVRFIISHIILGLKRRKYPSNHSF